MISPNDIIAQTNQYRVEQGLSPLKADPSLTKAAEARAKDMALTGNFSHKVATTTASTSQWPFMTNAGYDYRYAGENLATMFDDATSTMQGWRNSPSHNTNLINPVYADIGVAVVPGTYQGKQTQFVIQFLGTKKAGGPVKVLKSKPLAPTQEAPRKLTISPMPMDFSMAQSTPRLAKNMK